MKPATADEFIAEKYTALFFPLRAGAEDMRRGVLGG